MTRQKQQTGTWEVRRTLAVPALSHAADAAAVQKALGELPGLVEIHADPQRRTVQVNYDVTRPVTTAMSRVLSRRQASQYSRPHGHA